MIIIQIRVSSDIKWPDTEIDILWDTGYLANYLSDCRISDQKPDKALKIDRILKSISYGIPDI